MHRRRLGLVTITLVLIASACSQKSSSSTANANQAPAPSSAMCTGANPPATYKHVVWIWMENKDADAIRGSSNAPFLSSVAGQCASAQRYSDLGIHPSEPNYIEATSGGTQGIHNDDDATHNSVAVPNLFSQVRAAGPKTKTYAESMPSNCLQTSSGQYAPKHNPEVFYSATEDRAACAQDNVPFTEFSADLNNHSLPDFATIVPNMCNDMHDCSVATGDQWLRPVVTTLTSSQEYQDGSMAVFVVFDESEGSKYMPFFALSKSVQPGNASQAPLSHLALLRGTEEMVGLKTYLGGAQTATGFRDALHL